MRASSHELLGLGFAAAIVGFGGIGRPAATTTVLWHGMLLRRHLILHGPNLPPAWWPAIIAGAILGANLPDLGQPHSRLARLWPTEGDRRIQSVPPALIGALAFTILGCLSLILGLLAQSRPGTWVGHPAAHLAFAATLRWLRQFPSPTSARPMLLFTGVLSLAAAALALAHQRGLAPFGRRGASHSFLLILPPALLLLLAGGAPLPAPPGFLGAVLISLATHLVGDALTIRGIPLTLTGHGPMIYLLPKRWRIATGTPREITLLLLILALLLILTLAPGLTLAPPPDRSPSVGPGAAPFFAPSLPPW